MKKVFISSVFLGMAASGLFSCENAVSSDSFPSVFLSSHNINGYMNIAHHHGRGRGHGGGHHWHRGWSGRHGSSIIISPSWGGPGSPPTWWCARHGWPAICSGAIRSPVIVSPILPPTIIIR